MKNRNNSLAGMDVPQRVPTMFNDGSASLRLKTVSLTDPASIRRSFD